MQKKLSYLLALLLLVTYPLQVRATSDAELPPPLNSATSALISANTDKVSDNTETSVNATVASIDKLEDNMSSEATNPELTLPTSEVEATEKTNSHATISDELSPIAETASEANKIESDALSNSNEALSLGEARNASEKAIYLNPNKGEDTNDGQSAEKAVKTFAKAKELATQDQNINVIYLMHTLHAEGTLSLEGTKAIIKRYEKSNAISLIVVDKEKTLSLENITIDGNKDAFNVGAGTLIEVDVDATLNITDGTILQNNKLNYSYNGDGQEAAGGAVFCQGTINMTGGEIKNNNANRGGAIALISDSTSVLLGLAGIPSAGQFTARNAPIMNMSGGIIANNRADFYPRTAVGGGIFVYDGATLNLSGGEIKDNYSAHAGGGISLGATVANFPSNTLNMTGGIISNNTAEGGGGGILVQAGYYDKEKQLAGLLKTDKFLRMPCVANITGGEITNNKTLSTIGYVDFGGGGIYVNGSNENVPQGDYQDYFTNGILNLQNALIVNNTAKYDGAGYAACPSTTTEIQLKNGVAIYNNQSNKQARDIYIESGTRYGPHSGDAPYTISPLMLGGTAYKWKNNNNEEMPLDYLTGKVSEKGQQAVDEDGNELTGVKFLSLHTDVTEDAQAKKLAKVIISGNYSATRGGGIGSNGTVIMGNSELTEVKVSKTWQDTDANKRPKYVDIELYRSFQATPKEKALVGYQRITPNNDIWTTTFKNLPKNDNEGKPFIYTVKEKSLPGYKVTINGDQTNGYTLTNKEDPRTEIKVKKLWQDDNNKAQKRPQQIEVKLLANGTEVKKATLDANNDWQFTFTDLPVNDPADKAYVYTVEEVKVADYKSELTGDSQTGFVFTNTYIPPNTPPLVPPTPSEPPTTPTTPPEPNKPGRVSKTGELASNSSLALYLLMTVGVMLAKQKKH